MGHANGDRWYRGNVLLPSYTFMLQGFRCPVPVETTLAPQSPAGGRSSASVLMLELLDILDLPVKRLKTWGKKTGLESQTSAVGIPPELAGCLSAFRLVQIQLHESG